MQDPLSLLWVPSDRLSPLYILIQRLQLLRAAQRQVINAMQIMQQKQAELRDLAPGLQRQVDEMLFRMRHYAAVSDDGRRRRRAAARA